MADSQRKTANLFIQKLTGVTITSLGEIASDANYDTYIAEVSGGETYTVSNVTGTQVFGFFTAKPALGTITYNSSRTIFSTPSQTLTVPTGENIKYIGVRYNTGVSNAMLNTGSNPLPYEPYGWLHSLRKLTTATDTITTLPADLYADGNSATVGLKGNMSQSGTPTPTTPIYPSECGDMTENLWNGVIGTDNVILNQNGYPTPNENYALSEYIPVQSGKSYIYHFYHNAAENRTVYSISEYDSSKNVITPITLEQITVVGDYNITFTTRSNTAYIRINWKKAYDENMMLIKGNIPIPYEPYGQYKTPIISGGVTTPVYLGEVESTRRIKKAAFDGTETWSLLGRDTGRTVFSTPITAGATNCFCSHIEYKETYSTELNRIVIPAAKNALYISIDNTIISQASPSETDFKNYLAQQYSAGTPVTVWYILKNETTGTLNEPLRKIGDYADTVSGITIPTIAGKDTFDVLTTLKPSEVSLNYTGWHDASVGEWNGSEWQ